MSSCLTRAGGRTYGLDLEFLKSPSTSTLTSHTSSPSSTISESSNSLVAISTRKPRTPRKRPNQIYNEAAALLSTAYPNIFSTKNLTKPCKFTKQNDNFFDESAELLLPFQVIDSSAFLLHQSIQEKPIFPIESKVMNLPEKPYPSPGEINSRVISMELDDECEEDFDAESILDEEIEEGIDSIMGNRVDEPNDASCYSLETNYWCGNPMGLGIGGRFDFGFRREGVRAMRHVDEGKWWCFPTVDMHKISPRIKKAPASVSAEKNKKKVEKPPATELPKEDSSLLLKLNHDEVLKSWSDRGSPFSDELPALEISGSDLYARLAQIDLFSDGEGVRETTLLRHKEKRRTRVSSKKIRYQVTKVNEDRRPRMKV